MLIVSDSNTSNSSETRTKYLNARDQVVKDLTWLKANLLRRQNQVLDRLLENVETCTNMEWNGAFTDGFEAGTLDAHMHPEEV